ncbi:hypothetical protein BLNAU_9863 [Blattamonas nauphoetae]|uniref:Uncharacterized protein n=1 Tax=Blattamonas nauphoetae TaxID=2049346 RepID=A0ABQ9XUI2_9EUKA|nr:hypothetical protein BLNAU_9863 [Blattamonas nauphoetae]
MPVKPRFRSPALASAAGEGGGEFREVEGMEAGQSRQGTDQDECEQKLNRALDQALLFQPMVNIQPYLLPRTLLTFEVRVPFVSDSLNFSPQSNHLSLPLTVSSIPTLIVGHVTSNEPQFWKKMELEWSGGIAARKQEKREYERKTRSESTPEQAERREKEERKVGEQGKDRGEDHSNLTPTEIEILYSTEQSSSHTALATPKSTRTQHSPHPSSSSVLVSLPITSSFSTSLPFSALHSVAAKVCEASNVAVFGLVGSGGVKMAGDVLINPRLAAFGSDEQLYRLVRIVGGRHAESQSRTAPSTKKRTAPSQNADCA